MAWEYTERELAVADGRRERYAEAARRDAALGAAEAAGWRHDFHDRIDDDLDTPAALKVVDDLAGRLAGVTGTVEDEGTEAGAALLGELLDLLGSASAVALPVA